MFEHDLEKIGSAVSKHSENIKGFGFSTKKIGGKSKKIGGGLTPGTPAFWMYGRRRVMIIIMMSMMINVGKTDLYDGDQKWVAQLQKVRRPNLVIETVTKQHEYIIIYVLNTRMIVFRVSKMIEKLKIWGALQALTPKLVLWHSVTHAIVTNQYLLQWWVSINT